MSGGPYATGGMSPEGTTTTVYINLPEVSGKDKDVLCAAICECKAVPDIGKNGQSLRQVCVSKMLNQRDKSASYQSDYKAEVNYDMTKNPPVPIMNYDIKTKVHEWAPGWIKKRWNEDPEHPLWLPGKGYVRRPDVVIVKDPTKPPTQDNIKQVVEIKFANDVWGRGQKDDYEVIAGPGKLAELTPERCKCPEPKPESPTEQKPEPEKGVIDYLMDFVDAADKAERDGAGRGRTRPKRLPRK